MASRVVVPLSLFAHEMHQDELCAKREDSTGHGARIVGQLLTLMDGISSKGTKVVVFGSASSANTLDAALRRPGRYGCENWRETWEKRLEW